jgi:putative transposase
MARIARVVAPGVPHHVTQRGNNQQRVFFDDRDRLLYLSLIREHSQHHRLRVWGYCLMTNHVHLVAVPEEEDSLPQVMRKVHGEYARYVNSVYTRSGHLFQNRYYSCPLDLRHRWVALGYVELNPVRAGLTSEPSSYAWSSARAHQQGADSTGLLDLAEWQAAFTVEGWKQTLEIDAENAAVKRIRTATRTGRPLGDAEFVARVGNQVGRDLRLRKRGPKTRPASAEPGQHKLFSVAEFGG